MDDGIGVVSGVITCCPPMSCARRRTIMTQDDTKDEKATSALSTSGIVDQVDEEDGQHAPSMPPGILNI